MDNYLDALKMKEHLELKVKAANECLRTYPRLSNGLVPDFIRETASYKQAKKNMDKAFKELQDFNKVFVKKFKNKRD